MDDILDYDNEEKQEEKEEDTFIFFLKRPFFLATGIFLFGILSKIYGLSFSSYLITLSVIIFLFHSVGSLAYQLRKGKKIRVFDIVALVGSNTFTLGLFFGLSNSSLLITIFIFPLVGILSLAFRKK